MMERALAGAGVSLVFQDASLRIVYSENLPENLPDVAEGTDDVALFGEKDGSYLLGLKRGVLETGQPTNAEVSIAAPDGMKIYEIKIERTASRGATAARCAGAPIATTSAAAAAVSA